MTQIDPRALRNAFGSFMTGVTVVTALRDDGTPVGFTANSFASVSLDPPLLLVCPGTFLSSYQTFETCTHFAVNVLAEGQEEVSNIFARSKGDRFGQVAHSPDAQGVPLIDGAAVQFSCTTHARVPAGDHCVLIGRVEAFANADTAGLGYVNGDYFSLGLERAPFVEHKGAAICGAIVECGDTVVMVRDKEGLRPPQCTHTERGRLIDDLRATLVAAGIDATLGQAYSVFENAAPRSHATYFLADGQITTPAPGVELVPIADLAQQRFASAPIARMMQRFAQERQTGDFSLYLGDTEDGATHHSDARM